MTSASMSGPPSDMMLAMTLALKGGAKVGASVGDDDGIAVGASVGDDVGKHVDAKAGAENGAPSELTLAMMLAMMRDQSMTPANIHLVVRAIAVKHKRGLNVYSIVGVCGNCHMEVSKIP